LFYHYSKSRLHQKKGALFIMKMTKRDIAGYLGVDYKTIFNWEKNKPNLYKTVMKGLAFDEMVEAQKLSYEKVKALQEKYR